MTEEHKTTIEVEAEPNGFAEIVRVFLKYPGSAIQLIVGVVTLCGVWFALTQRIDSVHAEVTDVKRDIGTLSDVVKEFQSDGAATRDKINVLYERGNTRYTEILAKQAEQNIGIAEIKSDLKWIINRYNGSAPPYQDVAPSRR